MGKNCLLYYITDRTAFAADEPTRQRLLLEKIREAAQAGIDYIQLRENDLPARDLLRLAREALKAIREAQDLPTDPYPLPTALLINSRTDVAMAAGASGVHLRSSDASPEDVKKMTQRGKSAFACAVSCHSPEEVVRAAKAAATFAVFGPVFEKNLSAENSTGLAQLHEACQAKISVLALGGVTLANARACLEAGAAGIAAIRLFQENNVAAIAKQLRSNA
jgi:thiamine-phosphate pyrophosphorylase